MKHFALNDQETNRNSMLCTWSNEQAIREIYLKPFELAVKEGGADAVMSSFNYIGTEWAGGSSRFARQYSATSGDSRDSYLPTTSEYTDT